MSQPRYHYATVSEAVRQLRELGYNQDFVVANNCLMCNDEKYNAEAFDVQEVFRYEGNTDPADEATVYGIVSSSGVRGILVTGFGASADMISAEILEKLSIR